MGASFSEVELDLAHDDLMLMCIQVFVGEPTDKPDGPMWVIKPLVAACETTIEAMGHLGYEIADDGSLTSGDVNRMKDHSRLWRDLAQFVKSGGRIDCKDSDDRDWSWYFIEGTIYTAKRPYRR